MEKTPNKKLALLYILHILQKHSDDKHRLTQEAIRQKLISDYGIDIERRAVKRNIELLTETGLDIVTNHANGAYLLERKFTDGELRFLIDSVLFSPHVQERYAKDLMEKLATFGSVTFDDCICSVTAVKETFHEKNADLFDNIEDIAHAIKECKKVRFEYVKYDCVPKMGEMFVRQKTGDVFTLNPYKLVAHNGNYYLLGSYDGDREVVAFRVDKMVGLYVSDETATDISQSELSGKKVADYIFAHPYMYAGKTEEVQLKVPMYFIDEVVGTFGKDIKICQHDDWNFRVRINVGVNDITEWIMQNSRYVEILAPDDLRKKVALHVADMADTYGVLPTTETEKRERVQAKEYPYNLLTMVFGEQYAYSDNASEIATAINEQIESLQTDEIIIMKKLYLYGNTREETAQDLGISMEDLVMSEAAALRRLRHPSRSRALVKFIKD